MSNTLYDDIMGNVAPPNVIPDKLSHLQRFPFVILVDVSGSTGVGPDPDIDHINTSLQQIVDAIRNPPPSSGLAIKAKQIDLCILAYSDAVETVVPWSTYDQLPTALPTLVPRQGTRMGEALLHALREIGQRLKQYREPSNNTPSGMPHVLHLTDGFAMDMTVGDAKWQEVQARLTRIDGRGNPERQMAAVLNFVAPRGCLQTDAIGPGDAAMTGQQFLGELSGKPSVFAMGTEIANFAELVRMITALVTQISSNFGTERAAKDALRISKFSKL